MNARIASIASQSLQGQRLTREQLLELVELSHPDTQELLYWAWQVRQTRFGRDVRLCSIVAGKLGGCSENCKWCAQSAAIGGRPKYATHEDLIAAADTARQCGSAGIGIVNSGRKPSEKELAAVASAAKEIQHRHEGQVYICASLGELTPEQASRLATAGVARYNHNLESSRRFYPSVVGSHAYDDRLRTLKAAKSAGMGLCCGGIFGMGETWEDRVELALTLRDEVGPEIVPLNFLNPLPGTPLAARPPLEAQEILRVIAMFRLAMPAVDIKVAGGREANLRDLQSWIFYAGATSIITGHYLTTSGQGADRDLQMLKDLGMRVVREFAAAQ